MDSMQDRMMSVYRGFRVDPVPVGVYTRYLPRSKIERDLRSLGLGIIEYQPPISMLGPPWHLIEGFMSEIKNTRISIRYRWEQGRRIERREFDTPVGSVYQDVARDVGGIGSESILSHYVASPEDYRILAYLFRNSIIHDNYDIVSSRMQLLGTDGVVLARVDRSPYQKLMIELAGAERFLVDLYTDPDAVMEALTAAKDRMGEIRERVLNSPANVVWLPDNVTADMTPPGAFNHYLADYYREWVRDCRDANKQLLVHMDGKIRALVPSLNQIGIPVIESVSSPEIGGDMTLEEAQLALPHSTILPNIPSNWAMLTNGEIIHRLDDLLSCTHPDRACMLQFSEDLPQDHWQRVFQVVTERMTQNTSA